MTPIYFKNPEGIKLAYYDEGKGYPIVLANGLGGTFSSWRFITDKLSKKYRFISWDYRGLYYSEPPADDSPKSFSIENQASDLKALLDHLNIKRAILLGWSMGTQVILEFYKRHYDMVSGLGLICGTAGKPFETVMGFRPFKYILPVVFELMRKFHKPAGIFAKTTSSIPGFVYVWQSLGLIAASGDVEAFQELYKEIGKIDFKSYFSTMLMLGEHDAWDILPHIKVPTIIFAGEKDFFTPIEVARKIFKLIPNSKLVEISNASHYAPLEHPDKFLNEITRFVKKCINKGNKSKKK